MEYTELAAYRLHAGHVTTWTPTAAASWVVDPRPLSCNHKAHLRAALQKSLDDPARVVPSRGDNWIGTAFRIYRSFDSKAFREALRLWIARHEAYRTTAAIVSDGYSAVEHDILRRRTLPAAAVGVASTPVGLLSDAVAVRDFLEHHFAHKVSALEWPHLTVATVCPDEQEMGDSAVSLSSQDGPWFTVIFAADHAVMDAYTQIVSIAELREIYAAQVEGRNMVLPFVGSHVDFSRMEHDLTDSLELDHPVVQRWREFLYGDRGTPSSPRFPLPSMDDATDRAIDFSVYAAEQVSTSMWLLGEVDATVFSQVSKRMGGSQVTGLLAALKIAVSRSGAGRDDGSGPRNDEFRYVMPMHTRATPEFALSAGWFVGLMPVADPMPHSASFAEAIAVTTTAVKKNRDLVPYPYPRVAELLGVTEPLRFVISFVDTRFIPGADDWTPHDRTLRGAAYSTSDVYMWIVRTQGGVNISMRYPSDITTRESVRSLLAEYFTVLHSVVDSGGTSSLPFGAHQSRESVR